MADWKTITDDKEKYAAYLCSREWAVKREAVRERAGDTCERCNLFDMDACHHLTYERKYNENLEDLQAICNHCHEFTHGKCDIDPDTNAIWIGYVQYCARHGLRPVGTEWHVIPFDDRRDFIEKAVVHLCEQAFSSYSNIVEYSRAVGIKVDDDTVIEAIRDPFSAAVEIASLVNTGIYRWAELGMPSPGDVTTFDAVNEWCKCKTPHDLPIRKSDQ